MLTNSRANSAPPPHAYSRGITPRTHIISSPFAPITVTHFFGEIANDAMQFSAVGEVAAAEWVKTAEIRSYVYLDAWVVMPNHMHGIVIIEKPEPASTVETRRGASLPPTSPIPPKEGANTFGPLKRDSLQSIVNQYKGSITRWCKKNDHPEFAWQPLYYDHVIRTDDSLHNIREYLANNPLKWALDKENQPGLWM